MADTLREKMEAQKYQENPLMPERAKGFNLGLDAAMKLLDEHCGDVKTIEMVADEIKASKQRHIAMWSRKEQDAPDEDTLSVEAALAAISALIGDNTKREV